MDRSEWCKGDWGRLWGAKNVLFLDLGPNYMNVFTSPSDLQMAQMVKNPPLMRETWVQYLGQEDPLEEGTATHSSILAWRIPMDRGAWWATVYEVTKSRTQLSD